jgi:hypothetical protein
VAVDGSSPHFTGRPVVPRCAWLSLAPSPESSSRQTRPSTVLPTLAVPLFWSIRAFVRGLSQRNLSAILPNAVRCSKVLPQRTLDVSRPWGKHSHRVQKTTATARPKYLGMIITPRESSTSGISYRFQTAYPYSHTESSLSYCHFPKQRTAVSCRI